MDSVFRWGFVGTGQIAGRFGRDLIGEPGMEITAIVSRQAARGWAFAERHGIAPRIHASVEEMLTAGGIDIVYVAVPHSEHLRVVLPALEAGVPVLCEKPMGVNAADVARMIDAARASSTYLIEGMWSRFLPAYRRLEDLLAAGEIGEVRGLLADFGFRKPAVDPDHRLFNPAYGGGAGLDVGVYAVALAHRLLGAPEAVAGLADIGNTGVDEQSGCVLRHGNAGLSVLYAAIRTTTDREAAILGERGRIRLDAPFYRPDGFTLTREGTSRSAERYEAPAEGGGFIHEARAVAAEIRAGLTESPVVPLADSLAVARTMDALRARWGLSYPADAHRQDGD